jgi:hypothetical protein
MTVETDTLFNASVAQDIELQRTAEHLRHQSFSETIRLLVSWMGTDAAKRMNDFWDARGGLDI